MNAIRGAKIRPSAKQAVVEAEQEMYEEGLREYVEEFHPDEVGPRVDDSDIYRGLVEEMQDEEYQDFHSGVGVDGYSIETSSPPRVSSEFDWMLNPRDYLD